MSKSLNKKMLALMVAVFMLIMGAVIQSSAAGYPAFYASDETGSAGEEVTVTVTCSENPGISGWKIYVSYDSEALELVSCDVNGVFSNAIYTVIDASTLSVQWISMSSLEDANVDSNGKLFDLTFMIKDDAVAGDYNVNLSYDEDEVYKTVSAGVEEYVSFDTKNGVITVEEETTENTTAEPTEDETEVPATEDIEGTTSKGYPTEEPATEAETTESATQVSTTIESTTVQSTTQSTTSPKKTATSGEASKTSGTSGSSSTVQTGESIIAFALVVVMMASLAVVYLVNYFKKRKN